MEGGFGGARLGGQSGGTRMTSGFRQGFGGDGRYNGGYGGYDGGYGYGLYDQGYGYDAGDGYAPVYPQGYAAAYSSRNEISYCQRRYRSYDLASGTYLGVHGLRHSCP
jgi:hypothetical protein